MTCEPHLVSEVWKRIPFFPKYEVSTFGRVRSFKRKRPITLKPDAANAGRPGCKGRYLRVGLWSRGKKKHRRIHRLVAQAFVERPDGTDTVHHVDDDTRNNRADNLAWTTNAENIKAAWRTGRMKNSGNRKREVQAQ